MSLIKDATPDQPVNEVAPAAEEKADPFKGFITESSHDKPAEAAEEASTEETEAEAEDASDDVTANDDDTETADSEESEKAPQKPDAEKKKPSKAVEERIAAITAKRREAERQAASKDEENNTLKARIAELEKKTGLTEAEKASNAEDAAPDPNDFDYGEADPRFVRALAKYEARQEFATLKAQDEQARQAEAAAREAQKLQTRRDELITKGVTKYDDFETVVIENEALNGLLPSKEAAEAIIGSEFAHDILYHIGKNPQEVAALSSKPPFEQAKYIGRLEEKFSAKPAAPTEKQKSAPKAAPPPSGRARGSDGKFTVPDDTNDFDAFMAKHNLR